MNAFNALQDSTPEHPSMCYAYLSVTPKEGKDSQQCVHFRPITMLNTDLKLFTKIIAQRLATQLQKLIRYDQLCLLQGREAKDRTMTTIDLMYKTQKVEKEICLLSTDAKKAFDHILELTGCGGAIGQWRVQLPNIYRKTNPPPTQMGTGMCGHSVG